MFDQDNISENERSQEVYVPPSCYKDWVFSAQEYNDIQELT